MPFQDPFENMPFLVRLVNQKGQDVTGTYWGTLNNYYQGKWKVNIGDRFYSLFWIIRITGFEVNFQGPTLTLKGYEKRRR